MLSLPPDMLALSEDIPPPQEWILGCLKMPSGDVWLSDRPVSAELLNLLPEEPTPIVEDWGNLDDGGGLDKLLELGQVGFLCCPVTRIVLIRADQTKTIIDNIVQQGLNNRQIELYRWFQGMTSAPVLIDILFCQDKVELSRSSMLLSFDAVGALASENPYMTDRSNGNKEWPYLVGKAQGLPLKLLEEQSSKWTVLLGDQDGNDIDESHIGLIRVQDATKLEAGTHLINSEQVELVKVSAGYMEITARSQSGTEAQEHNNGSRIIPVGATFKYAVCAGTIGSFDLLRTSNELDIYDDDGDGDTTEYRDLYSGGNEEYHQELNPAQIWFTDRPPWLWRDQNLDITDKSFFGDSFSYSDRKDVSFPEKINKRDGDASILIDFQRFSEVSNDTWFKATDLCLPALPTDTSELGASLYEGSGLGTDYFTVSQSLGEYLDNMSSTAYRRVVIEETCPDDEEMWTAMPLVLPPSGWFNYSGTVYYSIVFQRVWTSSASIRVRIAMVLPNGAEELLALSPQVENDLLSFGVVAFGVNEFDLVFPGVISGEKEWFPYGFAISNQIDLTSPRFGYPNGLNPEVLRFKMYIKMEEKGADPSWGFLNIGGGSVYSEKFHYGMATFWQYYDNNPSAWISSRFDKDKSSLGTFNAARVRISGTAKNTNDFADGIITIYGNNLTDNDIEDAVYTEADGLIDFNPCNSIPNLQDGELVAFINTSSDEWDRKNFTLDETVDVGIYTVSPAPSSDITFGEQSILIQGAWRSVDLSNGNRFETTIELPASSWAELAATEITIKVALGYLLEQNPSYSEGKERIAGKAGVAFDNGIEWLVDYTSSTLDGLQVVYANQLFVDAVSSRGPDWTPAQAFQWIIEDKASWAAMLDTADLSARHAEYSAVEHHMNGLLSADRFQEAIREIGRQGFCLPVQAAGKLTVQSYLSWPTAVSSSGDINAILRTGQTFSPTDASAFVQEINADYNKNFSTELFDGQYTASTGLPIENIDRISLDLVKSDDAVQQAIDWLFSLKSIRLETFGFDGNFKLLPVQKWDKVRLPNFLSEDLQEDMIVVSVDFQIAQQKNDKPSKLIIKTIKV